MDIAKKVQADAKAMFMAIGYSMGANALTWGNLIMSDAVVGDFAETLIMGEEITDELMWPVDEAEVFEAEKPKPITNTEWWAKI